MISEGAGGGSVTMAAALTIAAAILSVCVRCAGPDVTIVETTQPAEGATPALAESGRSTQTAPEPPAATTPRPAQDSPRSPAPPPSPAPTLSSPPVLIDCATSAMSAKRLADLKVPYYPWFGQSADPESITTGTINVGILLGQIRKRMGPSATGWGMLDFEDPFDAWLDLPVSDPRNRKASAEMVRAIKAVKAEFPNVKWTYYGQPRMARQFPSGKSWPNGTAQERAQELDRRIASYSDILREVDWISPSIYDVYENALFQGAEKDFMLANETMWREQIIGLCRTIRERLGRPQAPIIPTVNLFFFENGRGTNMAPIPLAEVISDQVDPALRAGATGIAIWTSMDFFQQLATMPTDKELSQLNRQNQTAARAAWTKSFFGGARPSDWTRPEVKFAISQETGKIIADGAAAISERVQAQRSSPATTPK